jgi:ParB family chromosome partitioning protein
MARKKGAPVEAEGQGGVAMLEPPRDNLWDTQPAAIIGEPPGPAEFVTLRLDQLAESPHNPRKHFDPAALAELASSLGVTGMWEPMLVRPHKSGDGVYEIASGHRRFRAAKMAGLVEVPAIIRTMDDATFLEVLTVANLQREDVHPLEECDAYVEMMRTLLWDVPTIATKVGKGQTYIYDTLKFQSLIPEVREIFFAGTGGFSPAHAIQLSRISAEAQRRAIASDPEANGYSHDHGGLWQTEDVAARSEAEELALEEAERTNPAAGLKVRTVRELKGWIDTHVRFKAVEADPVLFPDTVAKVASAEIAKVKVVHITHEYRVHEDAKDADGKRTFGTTSWQRADGEQDSKGCPHAVLGLVVAGPDRGQAFDVCIAKDKCMVHWASEVREKAKRAKERDAGTGKATKEPPAPREQSWEREQRLREEARARFKPIMPKVYDALVAAVKTASTKAGGPLDQLIFRDSEKPRAKDAVPRGKSPEDLMRHLAYREIDRQGDWHAHETLPQLGKILGVDVAAIVKAHSPKEEKAAATEKAPKAKAKKKKVKR